MSRFFQYSYEINRYDLADHRFVIKGRMPGFDTTMAVIAILASLYIPIYALLHITFWQSLGAVLLLCAVLLLPGPFITRFKIIVSPENIKVVIRYFGIPTKTIRCAIDNVFIDDYQFNEINKSIDKHGEGVLRFDFSSGFDEPNHYVTMYFKGKELFFSAQVAAFEAELWKELVAVFREIFKVRNQTEVQPKQP